MPKNYPKIALLGPSLKAVSGVSTHLIQLFGSSLAEQFELLHFQVGSEGRREGAIGKLVRLFASPFAFTVFLLRHRPDIVHLNTSFNPKSYWRDLVYLFIARTLGRKVVYQVHGGALPEEFFAGNSLLTALLRRVLSLPDVVVLLGQGIRAAYRRFVPQQRLEVVANAIDTKFLEAEPIHVKQGTPLHLVYLGRLAESKGIFETVESLAMILGDGRRMRLTVAGSGPDEGRLKTRVAELRIEAHVSFAGALFGEAKDALWRSGDVFSFPTYREGLPYALLEAMAAGVVPITTGVGAIPDVLQDGVHGLLVKPRDASDLARALMRLDDDRAGLADMAKAGRERVLAEYSVARLAEDFRRIYAGLLAER